MEQMLGGTLVLAGLLTGSSIELYGARRTTVALGFFFNFGYVMFTLLVPLYAVHLGYSLGAIGLIVAAPAVIMIPMRLLSGPLTDVWGERRLFLILFCCLSLCGMLVNLPANALATLLVAQVFLGLGRGLYWSTVQSYLTRFPDKGGKWLGYYTTVANGAGFLGVAAAGPVSGSAGFPAAFLVTSLMQLVGVALALRLPLTPPTRRVQTLSRSITRLPLALGRRELWLAATVAIVAALPQALAESFWPVYLVRSGSSAAAASLALSLRNVGAMSVGLFVGPIIMRMGQRRSFAATAALLVIGICGSAWLTSPAAAGAFMWLTGVCTGMLLVLYIMLTGSASLPEDHSTGFAVVNVFFAATLLVIPLGFGATASALTMRWTFMLVAAFALSISVITFTRWDRWWSQRQSHPLKHR